VGIIPLKDILLQFSFYSGRENLKDLFFSGHTATLLLFGFLFHVRTLKMIFFSGAIVVGALLMIQHVHYSIDVVAAPFAAWVSVKASEKLFFKKEKNYSY
jgi:membrane-associated phospholipid phosphatase